MISDATHLSVTTASDIFECRRCGECCHGYGGTFVTESDITASADYIGISPDDFSGRYVSHSGSGLVLSQGEDGYCIFAGQEGHCEIHPVKPGMCKAWPFIKGVLRDPGNWYIMAGSCPGIRTDVSESTVRRCVEAVLGDAVEKDRKK